MDTNTQNIWHPISIQKPPSDGKYLITTVTYNPDDLDHPIFDVQIAEYSAESGIFFVSKFVKVIAWACKPLPYIADI